MFYFYDYASDVRIAVVDPPEDVRDAVVWNVFISADAFRTRTYKVRVDTKTDVNVMVDPDAVQSIYEIKVFAPFAALFVEKFVEPIVNVLQAQDV